VTQAEHTADSLPGDREAVDPELLELPAPPRGRRLAALVLMALVVVASMALVVAIRHDLAYFFAPSTTVDLGDVRSVEPASLEPNTHVRIQGTPMISRAVRYRRVLTGSTHLVFPLAGQRTVYVQVDDSAEAMAQNEFSGRLVTFSQLGSRIGAVEGYLGEELDLPVTGESFLLIADETPGSYAWALLLAGLCVLFVLVDLFLILRWFRPIDPDERDAESAEA
jgi:hypothetical protein